MSRAFRFGLNMTAATDRTGWTAKCQRAEELGYDVVLVPDHLGMPAPFPSLVLAAEATHSVRLGTFVLNAGFYNPVLLARDVVAFAGLRSAPTDGRLSTITTDEIDERVAFARAAADGRDYESNLLVQMVIPTDDRREPWMEAFAPVIELLK
ncbi:LLM class flavin-dependent oxidoreductase [Actinocrispum wychmicini]|uniref:Luciferase-like monooxygenase n=1 Tax=Actinocrispum wychmicini TaxID=1213861 RepID=A0A4R2IR93_9PSEU|nr:LLM class flavin-dependent oxidoreductase [Actinocrispum wychmicini]TCO46528.1 luciferase-like monooxygenase [Actinocrispum wychmicini]